MPGGILGPVIDGAKQLSDKGDNLGAIIVIALGILAMVIYFKMRIWTSQKGSFEKDRKTAKANLNNLTSKLSVTKNAITSSAKKHTREIMGLIEVAVLSDNNTDIDNFICNLARNYGLDDDSIAYCFDHYEGQALFAIIGRTVVLLVTNELSLGKTDSKFEDKMMVIFNACLDEINTLVQERGLGNGTPV